MKRTAFGKIILFVMLTALLLAIPVFSAGCGGQALPPPSSASSAVDIGSIMVPNTNLDVIVHFRQASATTVPTSLIGVSTDIKVESLVIWGIATDNKYSIGGALTFTSADEASKINSQVSGQAQVWTRLVDRMVYFVRATGGPGENLKSIITRNDFKKYDDTAALKEVAMMPAGGTTVPAVIGIVKPNEAMVNLVKSYVDPETAKTVDTIFTWAKPQVIAFGLYAPQQINAADLMTRLENGTIWNSDLGILVSVKSSIPGIVVSPIATGWLDKSGYPKTTLGQLTVYNLSQKMGGKTIPVLINVDGDRVFLSVAPKDTYAQTLITGIKR